MTFDVLKNNGYKSGTQLWTLGKTITLRLVVFNLLIVTMHSTN